MYYNTMKKDLNIYSPSNYNTNAERQSAVTDTFSKCSRRVCIKQSNGLREDH